MYDKASIALIPSGTKTGKLYSVLPSNHDGDFIFERGTTTTRVNKDGLIETVATNVPRLDYPLTNGLVGDCPHLLLEPSRTNEVTNSVDLFEYFNNTSNVTETPNATTSPDGSVSAYKYQGDGSSTSIRLFENRSFSENTTYALSVFAKAGTNNFLQLGILGVSGSRTVYFDLSTATASTEFGKIENYGNGWYRCIITASVTTGDLSGNANIYITKSLSETGFDSNADAENATMFLWGAQLEEGSYATSYIPTENDPSGVTRSADICNNAGTSAEFNDSEGVLFAEIASFVSSGTSRRIAISDGAVSGGGNNRLEILYSSATNLINFQVFSGGFFQGSRSYTVTDITDFNKVAVKYKKDDYALWINSVEVATMTSGNTPTGLNTLRFEDGSGGNDFYGKCKQLIVFNEALSDSELQTLTS